MANCNTSLALLEQMYSMVSEAWSVPMSNEKCIIERDKALDLIEKIKQSLPVEVVEARRIVSVRDELIGTAQSDAMAIQTNAEERAKALLDNHEIIRMARQKSDRIIADAEQKAGDLRYGAESYVNKLLENAGETLKNSLVSLQNAQASMRDISISVPEAVAVSSAPKVKKQQVTVSVHSSTAEEETENYEETTSGTDNRFVDMPL